MKDIGMIIAGAGIFIVIGTGLGFSIKLLIMAIQDKEWFIVALFVAFILLIGGALISHIP